MWCTYSINVLRESIMYPHKNPIGNKATMAAHAGFFNSFAIYFTALTIAPPKRKVDK